MSDFTNDNPAPEDDGGLAWPSASEVVPDDQVVAPDPETGEDPIEPEAPAAEAAPPAEPAEPATPAAIPDNAPLEALPTSWQDTIRDLRKENGDYRVQYKAYDEVFSNFNDAERSKFLDLASGLADESRHQEVAAEFITIGKRILEHYGVDVPDIDVPDPDAPMTRAQYEAAERQRELERDIDRNMELLTKQITDLGYELGSLDHYALLRAADAEANEGNPVSIEQAHEKVQAWKKGMIDSFIQEHAKKAGKHLPTPPQGGQTPADEPEPIPEDSREAFLQARGRFDAMLDAS